MAAAETSRYLKLKEENDDPNLTCYVCLQMKQRKPEWKQEGDTKVCFLCNNEYCDMHKSNTVPNTCEIDHNTYCSKARHRTRHHPIHIFTTMQARGAWVAQYGSDFVAGFNKNGKADLG